MKVIFMFQLNSNEKIENVFFRRFFDDLSDEVHNKISLLVEALPPEKSFIGVIDVIHYNYIKTHQMRNGSIAVIEKDGVVHEGDVFVDKDMNVRQYITDAAQKNDSLFFQDDHIIYRTIETKANAWGVLRAVLNVTLKEESALMKPGLN